MEVAEGNRGGREVSVGRVTPLHRLVTFAATQHESVELGELVAQKPQRPNRFVPKPHSAGSLSSPEIQDPVNESAGRAHTVKSARIWSIKPLCGLPHMSGFTAIISSLVADKACHASVTFCS